MDRPADKSESKKKPNPADLTLRHRHNYVGGNFYYKNSKTGESLLKAANKEDSVLIVGYGRARPVTVAKPSNDPRAGNFPIHNTPDEFRQTIELIPAKSLDPYTDLADIESLEAKGYQHVVASMTRDRLKKVYRQFSHLSVFAFNQMMCIATPDKRDFDLWCKTVPKAKQTIVAYPNPKTGLTQFIQVIKTNEKKEVVNIRHCVFDQGKAMVINETQIDKFDNVRQIAHIGQKGEGKAFNAVERFDDGTVTWSVTLDKDFATAALRPDDSIVIVSDTLGEAAKLAARNFGAENINEEGQWTGEFSEEACSGDCHPLQKEYRAKAREQIGNVIDGAVIPGLGPVFRTELI